MQTAERPPLRVEARDVEGVASDFQITLFWVILGMAVLCGLYKLFPWLFPFVQF